MRHIGDIVQDVLARAGVEIEPASNVVFVRFGRSAPGPLLCKSPSLNTGKPHSGKAFPACTGTGVVRFLAAAKAASDSSESSAHSRAVELRRNFGTMAQEE